MTSPAVQRHRPWYRQFWPWFLIAIPGSSVIVGILMVILALQQPVELVHDDWYKEGLAINQRMDGQNKARTQGIRAMLDFDATENIMTLRLENTDPTQETTLRLHLIHPTQKARDLTIDLYATPQRTYFGKLPQGPAGFYYVKLQSESGGWEIDGRLNFADSLRDVELAP